MEITGKIYDVMAPFTKGTFTKREFVLLDDSSEQYPQHIKFELAGEKINLIDAFRPGDPVRVMFNIRGREWINPEGKKVYFTTLTVWKIDPAGNSQGQPDYGQQRPAAYPGGNPGGGYSQGGYNAPNSYGQAGYGPGPQQYNPPQSGYGQPAPYGGPPSQPNRRPAPNNPPAAPPPQMEDDFNPGRRNNQPINGDFDDDMPF